MFFERLSLEPWLSRFITCKIHEWTNSGKVHYPEDPQEKSHGNGRINCIDRCVSPAADL